MGESERKGKEARELKASLQKETLLMKEIKKGDLYSACLGGFYSQPLIQNTKKNQKQKLLLGTKREENQKVTKESHKVKKQDK